MKKVIIKDIGLKLNDKWHFKGDITTISDEEYEKYKSYLILKENIKEKNERAIEIVVEDETIDIEQLKLDVEKYVKNYNKKDVEDNPEEKDSEKSGEDESDNPEEDENSLEKLSVDELKAKAFDLGINVSRMTNKEKIIEKIIEAEAPKFGEENKEDETPKTE